MYRGILNRIIVVYLFFWHVNLSIVTSFSLYTIQSQKGSSKVYATATQLENKRLSLLTQSIFSRINGLCDGLDCEFIDPYLVTDRVVNGVFDGITNTELDNLIAETAAYMSTDHPDYAKLAARLSISYLHSVTNPSFSDTMRMLFNYVDTKTQQPAGLICESVYKVIMQNKDLIDSYIKHDRDFAFDYFGYKTLEKSYLIKIDDHVVERPQYMLMRVALGIHGEDIPAALETYNYMSEKWFIHASPTLFHAGTPRPQMSSCFLLSMKDDSIDGIYDTLKQCALISKSAGGIGLSAQDIRAKGSYIKGTRGTSNGLIPMLRVFDATARYVDQGGGKRPGAFAIYIEPWHADIFEVLDLRKNTGKEEARARDLFYGLWVPDLFMKRVETDDVWTLMCPHECPGLSDAWGPAFDSLYLQYEAMGKGRRTVRARELWYAILDSQMETGTPYMLYKDSCNGKSNQQNLGTIKCSNLCTEIIEYTAPDEVAVCNLASIVLPQFVVNVTDHPDLTADADSLLGNSVFRGVDGTAYTFDFQKLAEVSGVVTRNLNRIIDRNYYPLPEAENSNLRHRPIGIGVQGLADAFQLMRLTFDGATARQLNRDIFETIYFAALNASCLLSAADGPYESYPGSPASKGVLQHDMWGQTTGDHWDWPGLRERIARHGLRNSLLLAPMPTASTAQILGYNECFEPYTSNIYVRRVRAGEFIIINQYLLRDLVSRGIWNKDVKNKIIADGGSVQGLDFLSDEEKELYRTVWEIKQKSLIDMAADRGAFIDQSQSMNCFLSDPDYSKLTSMHFYAWKKGLKTGMYYLRTKAAVQAIQFTIEPQSSSGGDTGKADGGSPVACSIKAAAGEACPSCSG